MEFQIAQVPGEAFVATAKIKRKESIKQAMSVFKKKCIMFSPSIRQFIWENNIYTLDGREVRNKVKYRRHLFSLPKIINKVNYSYILVISKNFFCLL